MTVASSSGGRRGASARLALGLSLADGTVEVADGPAERDARGEAGELGAAAGPDVADPIADATGSACATVGPGDVDGDVVAVPQPVTAITRHRAIRDLQCIPPSCIAAPSGRP
jgi:hypothetical protein